MDRNPRHFSNLYPNMHSPSSTDSRHSGQPRNSFPNRPPTSAPRSPSTQSTAASGLSSHPRILESIMHLLDRARTIAPPPPPSAGTTLLTSHDRQMASRQPHIDFMSPFKRVEQERWAHSQLSAVGATCVSRFAWLKVPGGYVCDHGRGPHYVTHELLAEGLGGCYQGSFCKRKSPGYFWEGPFYGQELVNTQATRTMPNRQFEEWLIFFPGNNRPRLTPNNRQ